MDLGTSLRNAREQAGFSVDELAARTRIPAKTLRAIEENHFDRVPSGIFVRSFIRTYANEVGVDPVGAIAEFRAMTEPVVEAPDMPKEPAEKVPTPSTAFQPELVMSRPSWGYVGVVAVLLVALIVINRYTGSSNRPAGEDSVAAAAEAPLPVGTSGDGIHIEMRAQGPCWVRAVVDGQIAFARVLQAGETQTVSGQRDVVMRIGDPAALSYSINGQPGESLGAAQVPVTVRFGSDGRPYRAS